MTARPLIVLLALAGILGAPRPAVSAPGPRQVVITGTRICIGDILADAGAKAAAVDLGPSPAAGVSRLVTRADIAAALEVRQVSAPSSLPDAVRVVRKVRHLAVAEMNAVVRSAIDTTALGRGVTLSTVRADRAVDVADGWTRVTVDVPRAPKKSGPFATTAIASFFTGDDVIARIAVPLDLIVSPEGASYDTQRGAPVTLIVRRSFVEIRASGFATADADIGDPIPIQLRPSGRVVRARLTSRDEAVALDGISSTMDGQTPGRAR